MDRRSFLKTGVLAVATVPFLSIGDTQAADVQIFIRNVEESVQTNRLSNSQLYFNHFYQPNVRLVLNPALFRLSCRRAFDNRPWFESP